jgi:hypothetical protein
MILFWFIDKFMGIIKNYSILIFVFMFLFESCDCVTYKSGLVLDAATNKPIPNAKVDMSGFDTYTDSTGYFKIDLFTGRCPDWNFTVTKDSFKTFVLKIDIKGDYTIYKVKDKNEYRKYDKPKALGKDGILKSFGEWTNIYSINFTPINKDSLIIRLEKNWR